MYGKIFERVFTGSMYGSGPVVFSVWAYVIAHAQPPGVVELNPKLLAGCIGTSVEEVRDAIAFLCRPDPESQNEAENGRRLVPLEGMGFRVVSFEKYRELKTAEDRREYHRSYWHRRKDSKNLNTTQQDSTNSTAAEALSLSEAPVPIPRKRGQAGSALFDRFWSAYPRKISKGKAERAFNSLKPGDSLVTCMLVAIERARESDQWRKDGGRFIPYPSTWLHARGWEDELEAPKSAASTERDWERRAI